MLSAAVAATPPPAQSGTPDERCLLAMIALSNSTEQEAARMGQTGVLFYAGRLKGRDPNFDFARLKSVAVTMDGQSAQTELQQRCGPTLNASIQQLQTALAPPASKTPPAANPSAPAPRKP
jgi:hypothetical protein